MDDRELDVRLHRHGAAWREANATRAAVDWDAVTAPRPGWPWFVVAAAVAAVAAAIAVPLIVVGGSTSSAPTPVHTPLPNPNVAKRGAPTDFVTLRGGSVTFVVRAATNGVRPHQLRATAVGVSPDGRTAFGAFPLSGCRTRIVRYTLQTNDSDRQVIESGWRTTIAGRPVRTKMAVSPDGAKLALAVWPRARSRPLALRCAGAEQLDVVSVPNGRVRSWHSAPGAIALTALQWAPDGRRLAYGTSPTLQGPAGAGYVLDTAAPGHSYARPTDRVHGLPTAVFTPLFWRHGQLATIDVRQIDEGLPVIVVHGLPGEVDSVSSDPTGDHLLLTSNGATYRWDNGVLSRVRGHWMQPGW
ncbi:MAG TPA: hypothetical protein VG708_02055 [Mycobacteriales bacterium]|nr:hypothetical protein [Mycobacteriales bacterium]